MAPSQRVNTDSPIDVGRVLTNKRENDGEQGCGREGDMSLWVVYLPTRARMTVSRGAAGKAICHCGSCTYQQELE